MKKCNLVKIIFPERLRALGADANLSEFARKSGLNQQDITRYLSHGALPRSDKLAQIATRFNVTTDWLLGLAAGTDAGATAEPTVDYSSGDSLASVVRTQADSIAVLTAAVDRLSRMLGVPIVSPASVGSPRKSSSAG